MLGRTPCCPRSLENKTRSSILRMCCLVWAVHLSYRPFIWNTLMAFHWRKIFEASNTEKLQKKKKWLHWNFKSTSLFVLRCQDGKNRGQGEMLLLKLVHPTLTDASQMHPKYHNLCDSTVLSPEGNYTGTRGETGWTREGVYSYNGQRGRNKKWAHKKDGSNQNIWLKSSYNEKQRAAGA
jgi:hypothetical protein